MQHISGIAMMKIVERTDGKAKKLTYKAARFPMYLDPIFTKMKSGSNIFVNMSQHS